MWTMLWPTKKKTVIWLVVYVSSPFFLFSDILQGRSICRALWDYYKISGHIEGCEILSEEVGDNHTNVTPASDNVVVAISYSLR